MKVACIGWGSLVWSPGVLRCKGEWQLDGPCLPLEFARTSKDWRLTLVLTDGAAPVPTLWTELDYADPESAKAALQGREATGPLSVGLWSGPVPRYSLGAADIAAWVFHVSLAAQVACRIVVQGLGVVGGTFDAPSTQFRKVASATKATHDLRSCTFL
jgi:hypothetical protein